ncbi:MASE1 domain-containing protein [Frateuria sp. GZRR33]|uniref:MASE1 domain-containing protein n=1 Tax=Frateuria sp. GZRR33 TaxID=3351535 RepID=UPI003EDC54A0
MPKKSGINIWLRHLAVAIAYAVVYGLVRQLSFSHWAPFAGLRFSALLLVPYRYWPALLVGEAASLAYVGIECADRFGWLWASFFMIPPMLFSMPLVRWCRGAGRIFGVHNRTNISVFLLATLCASLIWATVNMGTLVLMHTRPDEVIQYQATAARYFIGNYIGVLTLTPLVLLVREDLHVVGLRQFLRRLPDSRLAMETACLLVPALALLVWLASGAAGPATQEARMAMFLPVAWLSLRHGWRGAAVGGSAASVAVVLAMPFHRDNETLHAQVFVAFTVTTMFMLAARIAALREGEERERADARLALAVAQRNVYLGELQLRQTSHALEQVSSAVQASYTQLLGRLRCLLPGTDERSYYRHAAITQHRIYRLADSLYPLTWGERGLPAALREGSIPRALDEAGMVYWCRIREAGLRELSTGIHIALYRLAVEAVALACASRDISHLQVQLRCGAFAGRRWAVLRVDSRVDYEHLGRVRWDEVLPVLGGSGLGLGAIKDRAMIFGGKVRLRPAGNGQRLSLILFEPELA